MHALTFGMLCLGGPRVGFASLATGGGSAETSDTLWQEVTSPPRWGRASILTRVRRIGQSGGATDFGRITRIVPAPDGGIAVLDGDAVGPSLHTFDATGRLRTSVGRFGEAPGEITRGTSIAVTLDGEILAFNGFSKRLTRWSADGTLLSASRAEATGGFGTVAAIRPGPVGYVFVTELVRPGRVSPAEDRWTYFPDRFHLLALADGRVTTVPTLGALPPPTVAMPHGARHFQLALPSGRVVGVWSDRLGFHWPHSPSGRYHGVWRPADRPEIQREERIELQQYDAKMRELVPTQLRPPAWTIPLIKQIVTGATTDHQSRVWLRLATTGVEGPPRTVLSQNDGTRITMRFRDRVRYAAFLENGSFLGEVEFPGTPDQVVFSGKYAWGVEEGEDGLQYLVQYRLPD
jgi:hypothetical protein